MLGDEGSQIGSEGLSFRASLRNIFLGLTFLLNRNCAWQAQNGQLHSDLFLPSEGDHVYAPKPKYQCFFAKR
jgi:hypothetical protein